MIIGIVGSEFAKFTPETEEQARAIIIDLLSKPTITSVTSGHCHLGGIDIWTEEHAEFKGIQTIIYPADILCWHGTINQDGFMERNLKIARMCDEIHCITVKELPPNYTGMRFTTCYHCKGQRPPHIKSGGCWTAIQAQKLGKPAFWHIIG